MIDDRGALGMGEVVPFGRRPIPPRACVLENKTHVRTFIAEMLDELGFIAREAGTPDIRTVLHDFRPDLIVLGPLIGPEVRSVMHTLRAQSYGGKLMLFGGRSSAALIRNHEFGEAAGLAMLPPLGTPFRDRDLDANLACFLPGAEALVRVRHPTWGVVAPAYFVAGASDPFLHGFVAIRGRAGARRLDAIRHGQSQCPDFHPPAVAGAGGYAIYRPADGASPRQGSGEWFPDRG